MNNLFSSFTRTRQHHSGSGMGSRRFVSLWSVAMLLCCLSACATSGVSRSSENKVLGKLMVERLEWMDDVACVKKARSLPVNDPVREAQLLDAMAVLALESNLPAEPVRKFFSGQMVAAKERQEEWLRENASWKQGQQPVPDLAKTIRPALDSIGRKMIRALAAARRSGESSQVTAEARMRLEKAGYSNAVMAPALQGLEAGLREK